MLDVVIELRKYVFTRGGRAISIAMAVLAVGLAVIGALLIEGSPSLVVASALSYPLTVLEIGLPIVVVLLFTAEWSTRDAVQTFLLRPRRGVVLRSKCLAAAVLVATGLVLGVVTSLAAVTVRSLVTATPLSSAGTFGFDGALTRSLLTTLVYATFAVGVGLLVARTALAMVVYLGTITLVETLLALLLGDRSGWLSLGQAIGRLTSGSIQWADVPSLSTSLGLWLLVPLVLGGLAFLRREAR